MIDRVDTHKNSFFFLKSLLHCASQLFCKSNNYESILFNLKWYISERMVILSRMMVPLAARNLPAAEITVHPPKVQVNSV